MTGSYLFHFRQKTFRFKWGFSLLCLFLFCLCMTLGVWQLHRYAYKKNLLMIYHKRLMDPPADFRNFKEVKNPGELAFQSVRMQGHYLAGGTVLIQNRFYQDRVGFEVLTPFEITGDKKWVLVDRGWIKKPENKAIPDIQTEMHDQTISGHIKLLDEYQFILGKNILGPDQRPLIAERIDVQELEHILNHTFYPFVVRLNAAEVNGYVRDWTIVTVTPMRHMMYAVQWFALALIVFAGYLCFCFEGKVEEKKKHAKNQ